MELKAQVEQMKEEQEQSKEVIIGNDEYVTNTGTLDRYFIIKNNNRITESQ